MLHLSTGTGPHARRVVLGTYAGDPESLDAPQWAKLPADEPVVFRDSAAAVAQLLGRTRGAWQADEMVVSVLASLKDSFFAHPSASVGG